VTGGEDRGQPVSTNADLTADATATMAVGTDFRAYLADDLDLCDFDQRGDWSEILAPHGWTCQGVEDEYCVWVMPGPAEDGYRVLTGPVGARDECTEVCSAPLPFGAAENRYMGKFQAYTLLKYGRLDVAAFRAAAQDLRQLGYAEDDLSAAREANRIASPSSTSEPPVSAVVVDTWSAVDLGPYLDGSVRRTGSSVGLCRDDGLPVLYAGLEHAVIGEMEAGKSWFCLASAAAEMNAGHIVAYFHFEEADAGDTVERLLALGVSAEAVRRLFRFVGPDHALSRAGDLGPLLDPAPTLAVFDGVNEAMSLHDHAIRDEDGAAAFRRLLIKPFTKVGAATLSADHVVKDPEHRGRYALGSVHKANALNGALLLVENVEPFGRGTRGRSRVSVVKDRPGYLRRHGVTSRGAKTYLGDLTVDATGSTSAVELALVAVSSTTGPDGEQVDPDQARRADAEAHVIGVVAAISGRGEQATVTKVRGDSKISSDATVDALDRLVSDGRLTETEGPRKARIFSVTQPGGVVSESAPEASRPNLVTRPSKGRGNQVGSNDRTSGRVRSGQVGSTPEPDHNANDIDESNNKPSALIAGNQRTASSGLTADHDRSAAR
jgi:hypothetical protein